MPVKPVVLIVAAGTALAALGLTGNLLGRAAAGPGPSIVAAAARPTPSIVEDYQAMGVAQAPRLTAGAGPYGSITNTGAPSLALTFDDGPEPTWTPRILAQLRENRVQATFCLIGVNAQQYPELVRAIVADGHTLCNHSWSHNVALGAAGTATIRADLTRTNAAIRAAVPGAPIAYYRQPGGFWTARVVSVARELGMSALHWTVDPQDWSRPSVGSIVSTVTRGSTDGAVVLLHDGGGNRSNTVDAVRRMLPGLLRAHTFEALPTGGG